MNATTDRRNLSPRPLRALALAVLTIALLGAGAATAETKPISTDEAKAAIEALAEEALGKGAVGLSVAVAYGSEVIFDRGFGLAEVEHDVSTDAETIFRIGSISKQFTAALIMQQVEQGKIGLDDPISKYTDFPTGDHVVTVRHLLTHTSGIKSYTGLGEEWQKIIPLELSHEELLDLVREKEFDFAPNDEYRYDNTGYYLLGVILEEVTGKGYDELILDVVAKPLDLMRTRYGSNGDIIRNRAQGYAMEDGELKNDGLIGMSQPGAAGALLSTAGDLVRWSHALSDGSVVSKESYAQMTTPHVLNDGEPVKYGFGLSIGEADGLASVSHGGGINGFNSMLITFPESDVTIATISNSEGYRAATLARDIARAVHDIEIEIEDLPVPESEQKRLTGVYAFDQLPLEMTIRAEGDHLFVQATGQGEDRVLMQSNGTFRASFDNEVALEFSSGDPAPSLTLKQGGGTFEAKRKQ